MRAIPRRLAGIINKVAFSEQLGLMHWKDISWSLYGAIVVENGAN